MEPHQRTRSFPHSRGMAELFMRAHDWHARGTQFARLTPSEKRQQQRRCRNIQVIE